MLFDDRKRYESRMANRSGVGDDRAHEAPKCPRTWGMAIVISAVWIRRGRWPFRDPEAVAVRS